MRILKNTNALKDIESKKSEAWIPRYFTKPNTGISEGDFFISLMEDIIIVPDGVKAGKPLELTEWQKWSIRLILEKDPSKEDSYKNSTFLMMIPRKNGKTFLGVLFIIYHLLTAPAFAEIYSAGKDGKQAKYAWEQVKKMISLSPFLQERIGLVKTTNTFFNMKSQATYQTLTADPAKTNGINPYFTLGDEGHVWEHMTAPSRAQEFYDGLITGSSARSKSQLLMISTAGANVNNSLLGNLYKHGINIVTGKITDGSFGFLCWEADEGDDPSDPATWRKCHPNLAEGFIEESKIESAYLQGLSTSLKGFLRLYLNMWVKIEGDPFITSFFWDQVIKEDYEIPLGSRVTLGFDGSKNNDSTCIVIQEIETGHLIMSHLWEKDENDPLWNVSREEVYEAFRDIGKKYQVELVYADPAYWTYNLEFWKNSEGWAIESIPASVSGMNSKGVAFQQDLADKEISHSNDPQFTKHVLNGIRKENGGFGKASKFAQDRIDGLVAAVLANAARHKVIYEDQEEPLLGGDINY